MRPFADVGPRFEEGMNRVRCYLGTVEALNIPSAKEANKQIARSTKRSTMTSAAPANISGCHSTGVKTCPYAACSRAEPLAGRLQGPRP